MYDPAIKMPLQMPLLTHSENNQLLMCVCFCNSDIVKQTSSRTRLSWSVTNCMGKRYTPGFLICDVGKAGKDISARLRQELLEQELENKQHIRVCVCVFSRWNIKLLMLFRKYKEQVRFGSFLSSLTLPGAQRDTDDTEDDDGHGAAMLSVKSHVKLNPVELSNITSAGKLRSRHPKIKSKRKIYKQQQQ